MAEKDQIPNGYRQAITTAITVFLGFSLTFLRNIWGKEEVGGWAPREVVWESITTLGILLQAGSLFRALDISDDNLSRYRTTLRLFQAGVVTVVAGVLLSIFARS